MSNNLGEHTIVFNYMLNSDLMLLLHTNINMLLYSVLIIIYVFIVINCNKY